MQTFALKRALYGAIAKGRATLHKGSHRKLFGEAAKIHVMADNKFAIAAAVYAPADFRNVLGAIGDYVRSSGLGACHAIIQLSRWIGAAHKSVGRAVFHMGLHILGCVESPGPANPQDGAPSTGSRRHSYQSLVLHSRGDDLGSLFSAPAVEQTAYAVLGTTLVQSRRRAGGQPCDLLVYVRPFPWHRPLPATA